MVRINLSDNPPLADGNKLKEEKIVRGLGREKFKVKRFCCLSFFLILLLFLIVVAALVAKTGLVSLPFFSDVFYRVPHPTRQITIANQADFLQKNLNFNFNPGQGTASLELSEEQLTLLSRQLLSKNNSYFAPNLQAVIDGGKIEFFGLLLRPFTANITIQLKPYLADQKLNFELISLKIGDLPIPPALANWLAAKLFSSQLGALGQKLAEFNVSQLEVSTGKLILTVAVGQPNELELLNLIKI